MTHDALRARRRRRSQRQARTRLCFVGRLRCPGAATVLFGWPGRYYVVRSRQIWLTVTHQNAAGAIPRPPLQLLPSGRAPDGESVRRQPPPGGGGGATPRFWTSTPPPLTVGRRPGGGGGGFGTRPWCLIVCLWRRLLASRHRSF